MFDVTLNKKFRTEAFPHIFEEAVVAPKEFQTAYGVSILIANYPSLLYGPPGTGKTLLARATARVLFGESGVVLNFYEGVQPEDQIYDMDILFKEQPPDKDGLKCSAYHFAVKPRAFMASRFALLNEMNRGTKDTLNAYLSIFAEGEVEAKGVVLKKAPGKIIIDYNPYYGEFDPAFNDRIITRIAMEELDLSDQVILAKRKTSTPAGYVDDLSKVVEQKMTIEEMEQVWDDVRKVEFPDEQYPYALLVANIFRACVHKLGSAQSEFLSNLNCEECMFGPTCITRNLNRPILTRGFEALIITAKAFAYWNGRNAITQEDLKNSLKLVTAHRADLKSEPLSQYINTEAWFDGVVTPYVETQLEDNSAWKKAGDALQKVKGHLSNQDVESAGKVFNTFKDTNKDIVAHSLMNDLAGKRIETASRNIARQANKILDDMKSGEAAFTRQCLRDTEQKYTWLPAKDYNQIQKKVREIEHFMDGSFTLSPSKYKKFIAELGAQYPDAIALLGGGEGSFEHPDISMGVVLDSSSRRHRIKYRLEDWTPIKVFKKWSQDE